jgi:glycosyltransferase involved in cell wall biosynthesis
VISNREKTFLSTVLYVHNDERRITSFLGTLYEVLEVNFDRFEVICVNDGSTDESLERIRSVAQTVENPNLTVINMSTYQGAELSMNAGVDLTIGDFVFEFDSLNMDFPAETIMGVYQRSLEGYDIVSASPNSSAGLSSQLFYSLFNYYSNSRNKIREERFRIISRRAINRVNSMNISVPYRKAIRANCGLDSDVFLYKRTISDGRRRSRQSYENRMGTAVNSLILFTDMSYRIAMGLTLLMLALSIGVGAYTLAVYFGQNKPVSGWTTIMLFLSVAFAGIFLVSGIIIKYLSILMELVFKKQKYLVKSVDRINK